MDFFVAFCLSDIENKREKLKKRAEMRRKTVLKSNIRQEKRILFVLFPFGHFLVAKSTLLIFLIIFF